MSEDESEFRSAVQETTDDRLIHVDIYQTVGGEGLRRYVDEQGELLGIQALSDDIARDNGIDVDTFIFGRFHRNKFWDDMFSNMQDSPSAISSNTHPDICIVSDPPVHLDTGGELIAAAAGRHPSSVSDEDLRNQGLDPQGIKNIVGAHEGSHCEGDDTDLEAAGYDPRNYGQDNTSERRLEELRADLGAYEYAQRNGLNAEMDAIIEAKQNPPGQYTPTYHIPPLAGAHEDNLFECVPFEASTLSEEQRDTINTEDVSLVCKFRDAVLNDLPIPTSSRLLSVEGDTVATIPNSNTNIKIGGGP